MNRNVIAVVALSLLLVGCSGLKPYRSSHEKNLFITTDTEQGFFSGVDAALDIYSMRTECDVDYQGTVELSNSRVEVGLPQGVPAWLVFRFESSAFFSNTRSSMGYDVALYPEYGQVYDVNVSYHDNIYNVEVAERRRGGSDAERLMVGMVERACGGEST
ncbi:MAG: hypothetical protein R3192_17695 [Woeseiaceae bacterium]|nr:hypothetical protein [Woeseiaceae bacterium]